MRFLDSEKTKAITFSYDDGITQDIQLVELLNKYDLKCTFNINSELLSKRGMLIRNNKRISHYKIYPDDAKNIYEGHEIAAHTLTHPNLMQCDDSAVIEQVERDRLNLSELAGYDVVGMAYPGGTRCIDERIISLVKNNTGIKYARTTTTTHNFEPQCDLYTFNPTVYHLEFDKMMELGEEFLNLKTDSPKIFYIWGHAYEMDYESD